MLDFSNNFTLFSNIVPFEQKRKDKILFHAGYRFKQLRKVLVN